MPDFDSVTELLIAQNERKLHKLRAGIVAEINRLGGELKLVDDALAKKRSRSSAAATRSSPAEGSNGASREGLPRTELFEYVTEMGKPAKAAQVRDFLLAKGIVRRVEAVRNGLVRLERDGALIRTPDGEFAVAPEWRGGAESETE
jgi:hypothetical protein